MAAPATSTAPRRRVGIVGAGALGQYLIEKIVKDPKASSTFELAFVWNRSVDKLDSNPLIPAEAKCTDLANVAAFRPDVIVEVCHPSVTVEWGRRFLALADFYCGSPTAFADPAVDADLRAAAVEGGHGLYVPAGALWGSEDLRRMAARGGMASLRVSMAKHPESLKLGGSLGETLAAHVAAGGAWPLTLYDGPVRGLCPLAPNNVNTMACAAISVSSGSRESGAAVPLDGFDFVRAQLIADASLLAHVIEIEAAGLRGADGQAFHCLTRRYNPAPPGAVTGAATYASFLSSLYAARGKGAGVHLC